MKTRCMICQKEGETRFLPLYVSGSEGLDICLSCEMALVHHVRELMNVASTSRKIGYQNAKDVAKEKTGCQVVGCHYYSKVGCQYMGECPHQPKG